MKTGNCLLCPVYDKCTRLCKIVKAELRRIENGRKRKVVLVYANELTPSQIDRWNNRVYAVSNGDQ